MNFRRLVRRLMLGRPIEDGIEGMALVHSRTPPPQPVPTYIGGAKLNLVVEVPGRDPYKVKLKCSAPSDRYPYPGQVVPVLVDRRDPQRVQVDWDKMLSPDEQFERMQL